MHYRAFILEMNIKTIAASIIIAVTAFGGVAQTPASPSRKAAHKAAHEAQLANHKSKIDHSIIEKMAGAEIADREVAENGMSEETDALITDLLKEASTHIGKRYRSGAKGPSSFDCSGFSSYVYRQFGYNISPSSRAQYLEGTKVERNDLRKGDLVFFTSRSSGKNVGHVGIVYSVNKETGAFKFIHASIRGVKISEFEGYYKNRYIGAKRIIE